MPAPRFENRCISHDEQQRDAGSVRRRRALHSWPGCTVVGGAWTGWGPGPTTHRQSVARTRSLVGEVRTTVETWREGARAGHTHEPNEVTIQLDGLGRQLSELLPEPGAPEGSEGPVFVDESGRRSKSLRRLGWVLAAICLGYAVTLVVAVLGGNSSAPFLPLSGQEEHRKTEEVRTPATPGQSPGAQVTPGAAPGASPSATPRSEGSAAAPVGAANTGGATSPGTGSSASAPAGVPSAQHSGTGSSTAGGEPDGETSASAPPAEPGTPSADPTATPPDPVSSTASTPDPPVQEQEGAS